MTAYNTPTPRSPQEELNFDIPSHLAQDEMHILLGGGGYGSDETEGATAFLHGGEHFDDVGRNMTRLRRFDNGLLPRDRMLAIVESKGLHRPTPKEWVGRTPRTNV